MSLMDPRQDKEFFRKCLRSIDTKLVVGVGGGMEALGVEETKWKICQCIVAVSH